MGLNDRHSSRQGRNPTSHQKQVAKKNRNKYDEGQKKRPFNFKLWFFVAIIIVTGYLFLKQIENYLIQEVYVVNKSHVPRHNVNTIDKDHMSDLIKEYQYEDKLPYNDEEIAVILLVLDSFNGQNRTKTNQIKSIIKSELTDIDKKIKKKYYIIEIDNTEIIEDNRFRQEEPWNWLLKYKVRSVLNYGRLPNSPDYVNINEFVSTLKSKFKNSVVSINIGTVIQDSIFAYESLMDIGKLTQDGVIVTVSPGNYKDVDGLTERLKNFKYYTMQRIAFQLLEDRLINIKNFKIALNADKIAESIKDNPKLYNEFLNMRVRSGMNNKIVEKKFIKKWVDKYPEMFYSEQTPMEYFAENKEAFDKDYEKEAKLANPKINISKTQEELKDKIKKDREQWYD